MILICGIGFAILSSLAVSGASISLLWNPSPSTNAAGYILYYGVASGQYTTGLNVGTNTKITVTGLTPGQTYYFVTACYNPYGLEGQDSNEITNTMPSLPLVLAQPVSQSAAIGTIVALSANVVSASPVTFQWFAGGKAIAGATNSMLILPQILKANAGTYYLVASNAGGSVTSHTAVITALDLTAAPSGHTPAVLPGVYDGLFYQTTGAGVPSMTDTTSGFLSNFTIGTNGGFSSRFIIEGQSFTCSGVVNAAGEITAVAQPSQAGLSNLSLSLYPDAAFGAERITGVVSNMNKANPWVASISAVLQTNSFSPAAVFLFLSPPIVGQVGQNRTCQLTISTNGAVALVGQLGDGTSIAQSGFVGADGSFPVYQSLYSNTGFLAGWISFAEGAPLGNLTWIQPINPAGSSRGFTNTVSFGAGPGLSTNSFQLIP